jgi:hypothetical protein
LPEVFHESVLPAVRPIHLANRHGETAQCEESSDLPGWSEFLNDHEYRQHVVIAGEDKEEEALCDKQATNNWPSQHWDGSERFRFGQCGELYALLAKIWAREEAGDG